MLTKRTSFRSRKLLNAAEGQPCTVNSPYCNYDVQTTIAAHFNEQYAGKGGGQKADDFAHVQACSSCHDYLDGKVPCTEQEQIDKEWYWRRAFYRTLRNLFDREILTVR